MPPLWPLAGKTNPSTGGYQAVWAQLCFVSVLEKGGFTAVVQPNRTLPVSDHALPLRLLEEDAHADGSQGTALVESYRRLADVFHDVLAEQSLDALLDRIADALAELVPHDSLTIYEADEPRRLLIPVWARDKWADKILADNCPFGQGLTGWGVEHR